MDFPLRWRTLAGSIVVALLVSHPARAEAEAIPGTPFGVGAVTIPLAPGDAAAAWNTGGLTLSERQGRTRYPVFTVGRVRRLLGNVLGADTDNDPPNSVMALFLFTGNAPLELTVYAPVATSFVLAPQPPEPRAHQRLLLRWWREYSAAAHEQIQQGDYPPLVQTYLTSMLSRRLGLAPPLLSRITESKPSEPVKTLQLLLGAESLRLATMRRANVATEPDREVADQPVPAAPTWLAPAAPPARPDVEIEPIALHVPQECLYIHFGSFENYLWYNRLQREYGGDISRMITLRGIETNAGQRMQQQLGLQHSALAEVFGPTIVADVALIGRDLYLNDGAAIGVLLQARNATLLGADLTRQRAAALQAEKENVATLTTVQIAGRDVPFLSTPDNRLRSYLVADGDYHLVTTSRVLAQRFLEVREGHGALGNMAEFRHARTLLPTRRQDTMFLYFSSAFFQGLISPQYQIELARRLRAAADMDLLSLATLAARVEQQPSERVEDLIRAGLLPPGFDRRPDGSGPVLAGRQAIDSLRGGRGSYLPIPDVDLHGVTPREAAAYASQAAYYSTHWKQMDPLIVGVKRFALDRPGLERVAIDAHVSPFAEEKYGWITSIIGPPTRVRIRPAQNDLVIAQAAVKGGLLLPSVPPHHLFLGIQDSAALTDLKPTGLLKILQMLRTTPGYLGAWPKPGFLDWLPGWLGGGPPDPAGFSRLPLDVWRRQWDGFSVLSFDPQLLARVTPELVPEEAENEAQFRVHIGDVSQAQLQSWVNSLAYSRAYQVSVGNARLLHALSQQLGVPREDALLEAQRLLDAKLVCSLGGEYQLEQPPGGLPLWASTKWPNPATGRPPADFRAPLLDWFRGLEAELTKYGDRLIVHATIDMQRKPTEKPKADLPLFDFNWFGGDTKKDAKPAVAEPAPEKPKPAPPAEAVPPPPAAKNGAKEF